MIISLVVAVSKNYCIGKDNQLLWHLPVDMAYFKELTMGGTVLMGRKTYFSIPEKFRPLPNRNNIVVSKNLHFIDNLKNQFHPQLFAAHSIEEALEISLKLGTIELFIIGGAEIYQQTFSIADRLYVTHVDAEIEGDAHFPEVNSKEWLTVDEKVVLKDEKNKYDCTFVTYQKISHGE